MGPNLILALVPPPRAPALSGVVVERDPVSLSLIILIILKIILSANKHVDSIELHMKNLKEKQIMHWEGTGRAITVKVTLMIYV